MISAPTAPSAPRQRDPQRGPCDGAPATTELEPARVPDHIDAMYRAARVLCRSPQDAEDLVQETFVRVLSRPRFVRRDHELVYLLRALATSTTTTTARPPAGPHP